MTENKKFHVGMELLVNATDEDEAIEAAQHAVRIVPFIGQLGVEDLRIRRGDVAEMQPWMLAEGACSWAQPAPDGTPTAKGDTEPQAEFWFVIALTREGWATILPFSTEATARAFTDMHAKGHTPEFKKVSPDPVRQSELTRERFIEETG